MYRPLALAALLVVALAGPPDAQASAQGTVSVAAASSLRLPLEAMERAFERTHPGVDVAVTLGASGAFVAQLRAGAPFDLFLSADLEYPRKVAAAGLAEGEPVVYAIGALVVWAPKGSRLDLEGKGLAALAGPEVKRLAIANPAIAPWGRAAEGALRSAGILDAVRSRLVYGQSVAQAAQFAATGSADAALLPRSLTFAPELRGGRILALPAFFAGLPQAAVLLRAAPHAEPARAFLRFLTGAEGRAILAQYGYALP